MRKVSVVGREIGRGEPVFIIAEIGYNFNYVDEAKQSIDAAIECGVDAVKFQTFRADTVTTKKAFFPEEAGATSQYEEFKQYELSEEAHWEIFGYAKEKGIIAFSTPAYYDAVELLEGVDVPIYKIGSDDMTNYPFLKYVAEIGRPIILSTGMANLAEVDKAVSAILSTGNDNLILLHCVSNYPIKKLETVNLRAIKTLEEAFQLPVGFSDHTTTLSIPIAAVAMGAVVIERHFTIDKNLKVPDAFLSADPKEMKAIVDGIRGVEQALGTGMKLPAETEVEMRQETRKSIIAKVNIPKGESLSQDNIIIKRPGTGIAPEHLDIAIGRTAKVDIEEDTPITWDMIS